MCGSFIRFSTPVYPGAQWVLSLPKRLRYFLQHAPALTTPVLRIFLDAVEHRLKARSPGAPEAARFGAVTFVHRFGSALNANLHFHCAILDGVLSARDEGVKFHEATALGYEDIAAVQRAVRTRVLRLFARGGLITPETTAEMHQWDHGGGFSLDARVRIEATDRKGLESQGQGLALFGAPRMQRLLRYCARSIFASERLVWTQRTERRGQGRALHAAPRMQRLIYQLPKPRPDGQTVLSLTSLEFLERLATLIPPPRRHRHRYHGVLAPNAPLRAAVTARAGLPMEGPAYGPSLPAPAPTQEVTEKCRSPSTYWWAMLLARVYEVFPLVCSRCGEPMRIIAFVTEVKAGQRDAEAVADALRALGCTVRVIDVVAFGLPPKGGAVDWLAANPDATAADIDALLTIGLPPSALAHKLLKRSETGSRAENIWIHEHLR